MSIDRDQILDLIQTIYEHMGSRKQWGRILSGLQKILNLNNMTVLEVNIPDALSKTVLHWDVQAKYLDMYKREYARLDSGGRDDYILPIRKGNVVADNDIESFRQFRKTSMFNDFFMPQGSYYFLASMIEIGPINAYLLSTQRRKKAGDFSPVEKQDLKIITPHLANRIDIERRFEQVGHVNQTLDLVLESQQTSCVLLDGDLKVAFANKPAEELLTEGDGISLTREGRLTASRPGSRDSLRGGLEDAQAICKGQGLSDPGIVRVERPSEKQPYTLIIRPCSLSGQWTKEPAGVLVLIIDPEVMQRSVSGCLMQTFGLTVAEAEVAMFLMRGFSPKRIAEMREVSMPTVRSQIRGLLEKTYVTSQVEFVSLAFRTLGSLLA